MANTNPIRRQPASEIVEEALIKPPSRSPIRICEQEKLSDTTTSCSPQNHRLLAAPPSPPILRSEDGESSPKSSNSCGGEDDSGRDSLPDGSGSDSSSGECGGADGNSSPTQSPPQPLKPSNSFQTPKKRANNSGAIRQLANAFEVNSNSSKLNNSNTQELSFITDPPPLPLHRHHYPESSTVDQTSPPPLKDQPFLVASPSTR